MNDDVLDTRTLPAKYVDRQATVRPPCLMLLPWAIVTDATNREKSIDPMLILTHITAQSICSVARRVRDVATPKIKSVAQRIRSTASRAVFENSHRQHIPSNAMLLLARSLACRRNSCSNSQVSDSGPYVVHRTRYCVIQPPRPRRMLRFRSKRSTSYSSLPSIPTAGARARRG